jgi:hypothetical protein
MCLCLIYLLILTTVMTNSDKIGIFGTAGTGQSAFLGRLWRVLTGFYVYISFPVTWGYCATCGLIFGVDTVNRICFTHVTVMMSIYSHSAGIVA